MKKDHDFMELALEEARLAAQEDEVPVGAVLVDRDGALLARAHNETIKRCDPTAHAEILALRGAAQVVGNFRLLDTTLYVTIEPCAMCMGALLHARVARIVFGAGDSKWGCAGSLYNLAGDGRLNHSISVDEGILKEECRALMQAFFRDRRNDKGES